MTLQVHQIGKISPNLVTLNQYNNSQFQVLREPIVKQTSTSAVRVPATTEECAAT